jgi:hypothetical protein
MSTTEIVMPNAMQAMIRHGAYTGALAGESQSPCPPAPLIYSFAS